MRPDALDRLLRLPPTALLLLSSILDLTDAHALPRQTKTVEYKELNVIAWPPLPTTPPINLESFNELLRRQDTNTICGYIGGDPGLPATCSAGSHCVLDAEHGAMGCCPNGQDSCTTGVFTGCVDSNSGAQTEVNPYVFTCQGSDVCYKNVFDGGYFQYGCGTASDLATTVHASASGLTSALDIASQSVSFTETPSSLATPTSNNPSTRTRSSTRTTASSTSAASSSRSSSKSSTSSSSSSSSSSRTSSSTDSSRTPTATTSNTLQTAEPSSTGGGHSPVNKTGAIIGGTISGVAILIALVAVGFYLWRRHRRGNTRRGPGPAGHMGGGNTQYISPMSGGAGFAPVYGSQEQYETGGLPPTWERVPPPRGGTTTEISSGGPARNLPPMGTYRYPGQNPAAAYHAGGGAGAVAPDAAAGAYAAYGNSHHGGSVDPDQVPLRHGSPEIEDFSRGFNDALSRIGEEDESDLSGTPSGSGSSGDVNVNGHGLNGHGDGGGEPSGDGMRPLWQQNRRQSRNMMWM